MQLRIVWRSQNDDRDIDVRFPAGAQVADLLAALKVSPDVEPVYLDGAPVATHRPIESSGLRNGSVVSLEPPGPIPEQLPLVEVRTIGGPSAGGRWLLPPGTYRIGTSSGSEIQLPGTEVLAEHAFIIVDSKGEGFLVDRRFPTAGRSRRTRLATGDSFEYGANMLGFVCPPGPIVRSGDGPRPAEFNRPPRTQQWPAEIEVVVPETPIEPPAPGKPGWASLIVPLVMGGLFALLFYPMMAVFAVLGPMMMLGNWVEDRRRSGRARSARVSEFDAALKKYGAELKSAAELHAGRLRTILPDAPEVVSRALGHKPGLWERRPDHSDFLQVALGTATISWIPRLVGRPDDERAASLLSRYSKIEGGPVGVEVGSGSILGVAGERDTTLALSRWVALQVAVHQGPADVRIAVLTDHPDDWDWVKWLPHTAADPDLGIRLLAATPGEFDDVLAELADRPAAPATFLIVDTGPLDPAQRIRLRTVQTGPGSVASLVIKRHAVDLPDRCSTVVEIPETDPASCRFPSAGRSVRELLPTGVPVGIALEAARAIAGLDDPEVSIPGNGLPDIVPLIDLLGSPPFSPEAIVEKWEAADHQGKPIASIGVTERGPLTIDLVDDGPHGLIAGTTGSGKSELLRSLIVALAASTSPNRINFALIDYKGGSAFDVCGRLPHVVGVVTDLDANLGRRALTCLDAELRHREARLRRAGVADLSEFPADGTADPLPRLVVVIDEFAALTAELPDFVPALVDIAQRGRSLGVHLLLATQRPAGVVSESIRANANLRIALRVHDAADSRDVLDDRSAAMIPRGRAGRGYVRLGPGELIPFQTALVGGGGPANEADPLLVAPFRFGHAPGPQKVADRPGGGPTDLDRLVEIIASAADAAGYGSPRPVWPPELPDRLSLADIIDDEGASVWWAPIGLVDEPLLQRQSTFGWEGASLLAYGMRGSGSTEALVTLAKSLATRYATDRLHIYAIDFGDRTLARLEELPHVGAVIGPAERERQLRLLRYLQDEIATRRAVGPHRHPAIVLLLDNYGGFSASFDQPVDLMYRDGLRRIVADGPAVDVFVAMSADQAAAVPAGLAALIRQKLVFRLSDSFDYPALGLSIREVPDLVDGRAVEVGSGLVVQMARVTPGDSDRILIRSTSHGNGPVRIGVLPERSEVSDVVDRAEVGGLDWFIPVGIGDRRLEPVGWVLGPGDCALIAGSVRSGRSTALVAISGIVADRRPDVAITALAPRRSPLRDAPAVGSALTGPEELDQAVGRILDDDRDHLLLVDDADDWPDPGGLMQGLMRARPPNLRVIGAGRSDVLRASYGHWTGEFRQSRLGIALGPQVDMDGELWHTSFPRHTPGVHRPGRGYLINNEGVELIQVAHP